MTKKTRKGKIKRLNHIRMKRKKIWKRKTLLCLILKWMMSQKYWKISTKRENKNSTTKN